MDQEANEVAGADLPDEHLNAAPAESASKPVEKQAKPEPVEQSSESTTEKPTEAQPQENAKKGGVQKRIDELTRERYEAQRAAEYWQQQAAAAKAQPEPAKSAPRIEDYSDVNQFLADRDTWTREQTKAEILREFGERQQRQQQEAMHHQQRVQQQQTVERFYAQEADARGRYQDYDAAVASPLMTELKQVRPDVIQTVIDSPVAPDVAYFLAKNPQAVQQIAQLNPHAAAREIGRIELMFMRQQNPSSNAPPPPRTLNGRAEAGRSPENMTLAEYRKWRASK